MTPDEVTIMFNVISATWGNRALPWNDPIVEDAVKVKQAHEWRKQLQPHERGDARAAIDELRRDNPDHAPSLGTIIKTIHKHARTRLQHDPTDERRAVCDGTRWIPIEVDDDGISTTNTYKPCPRCNPLIHNAWEKDGHIDVNRDHQKQWESINTVPRRCGT